MMATVRARLTIGRATESLGGGRVRVQVIHPVSWTFGSRRVMHWNAPRIGVGPSRGRNAMFLYLSVEHPFRTIGR
jgi:hypothetical protein